MKNVLITGASSGIGRATALRLARTGLTVFATVRSESDGAGLQAEAGAPVVPLLVDVTQPESVTKAAAEVEALAGSLDGLVNNAGEGVSGPLELLTDEELRSQLDVNLVGQVSVTRAMLPLLRRSEGPRIVMVGSVGGRLAFPFAGAYHASKFAMEAVSEVLRQELRPDRIEVTLIEPGPFSTPIWEKARDRIPELKERDHRHIYSARLDEFAAKLRSADERGGDPDQVAKEIEKALTGKRPSARVVVGLPAAVASRLRPLVPDRLFDAVASRAFNR